MPEKKKLPALSANGRKLILKLAQMPRSWTTAALAESVGVSRRTIMRELPGVEDYLAAAGYAFQRSPGQGVRLDEPLARRDALVALLDEPGPAAALPREERRRAVGALLQGLLPLQDWDAFLDGKLPSRSAVPALLDAAAARAVQDLLQQFEQEEGLHFTDNGFLSLLLHLTLTIQQLRSGVQDTVELVAPPDLSAALRLARRVEDAFGLALSRAEVSYLALYLDACQGNPNTDGLDARELNTRYLAACLIDTVSRQMGADLRRWPSLAGDLYCHLRPMLHRLSQGIQTDNPQLGLIQERYPRLWRATRFACDDARARLNIPAIPDAEAGYLAMHFGAVLEQEAMTRARVRVVVCPCGMASSRFLASQLEREFPAFERSSGSPPCATLTPAGCGPRGPASSYRRRRLPSTSRQ